MEDTPEPLWIDTIRAFGLTDEAASMTLRDLFNYIKNEFDASRQIDWNAILEEIRRG